MVIEAESQQYADGFVTLFARGDNINIQAEQRFPGHDNYVLTASEFSETFATIKNVYFLAMHSDDSPQVDALKNLMRQLPQIGWADPTIPEEKGSRIGTLVNKVNSLFHETKNHEFTSQQWTVYRELWDTCKQYMRH